MKRNNIAFTKEKYVSVEVTMLTANFSDSLMEGSIDDWIDDGEEIDFS